MRNSQLISVDWISVNDRMFFLDSASLFDQLEDFF